MTERKTVRRWWSSVTINRTGFWLTEMAEQGWALEDIQENRFVFQKTEPQYQMCIRDRPRSHLMENTG